jgi:trimethylguanosine synthase
MSVGQNSFNSLQSPLLQRVANALGPECIAIDPFAGVGGNAIQLALTCASVTAIEIDPQRGAALTANARVYGVEDKVHVLCADFLEVVGGLRADVAFYSPPWGGPAYSSAHDYDPEAMGEGQFGLSTLLDLAFNVMGCRGVVVWLPRNTRLAALEAAVPLGRGFCEVERAVLNGVFKGITVYYGAVARNQGVTKFTV